MAEQILETANSHGQQLEVHAVTEGDGSCFYHALKDQIETLRRPNSIVFARGGATACRSSCRDGHVSYVTRSFQALLLTGEATELRTMQTRDKRDDVSKSAGPGLGCPHC